MACTTTEHGSPWFWTYWPGTTCTPISRIRSCLYKTPSEQHHYAIMLHVTDRREPNHIPQLWACFTRHLIVIEGDCWTLAEECRDVLYWVSLQYFYFTSFNFLLFTFIVCCYGKQTCSLFSSFSRIFSHWPFSSRYNFSEVSHSLLGNPSQTGAARFFTAVTPSQNPINRRHG